MVEDMEVEHKEVVPYLYRLDGDICIDFVRPVMRVSEDHVSKMVEAGSNRYLHRCVEVAAMKSSRMLLEMAENLDWGESLEIHEMKGKG